MELYNYQLSRNIFSLNRYTKKSLAILTDIFICILSFWLAIYLRTEEFIYFKDLNYSALLISCLIALPIFWIFGLYRTLFRYAGLSILFTITSACLIYGFIYFFIISIFGIQDIPRSVGVIQPLLLLVGIISSRFFVKYILTGTFRELSKLNNRENVLIYGAGSAGRQLLLSLENNSKFRVIGFIDDNTQLQGQYLLGQRIYSLSNLDRLKKVSFVKLVLFAIPSVGNLKKNEIINKLNDHKVIVKSLPNINDIIDEKVSILDIKDYLVDDLLNREIVKPNKDLLEKNIKHKTVLVTGAGGTIGSELSRQILKLKPVCLILFELNEYSLYKLFEELKNLNNNIKIIPLLGNIQDQNYIEKVFSSFRVETIYHAAAYKHVPLVEANICEGIKNNVFGTLALTKAVNNSKVKNFVLVSSDKAVKPANVMGASKRFAELCLQVLKLQNKLADFSIVRFGNVLESSGSVIPKFKHQIIDGGPITLTHPEVTRYFMTVSEAAQLVLQAGALGKNSEVFLLDMGKRIKIKELILRMVNLSGLKLKDKENPDGDIEIKIVGLRPGEKLYEELLIGDDPQKTIHSKIKKISEPTMSSAKFENYTDQLSALIQKHDVDNIKKLLETVVNFNDSNNKVIDYIHLEDQKEKENKKYNLDNIYPIK